MKEQIICLTQIFHIFVARSEIDSFVLNNTIKTIYYGTKAYNDKYL